MNRYLPLGLVAIIGLGLSVQAQSNVAGTWTGEAQGRGGTQEVTLVLAVDGNALTGTFTQGDQSAAISEGMVDGDTVSFQRTVGRGFMLTYSGEVDGDTLTLTPMFDGGRGGGRPGGGRGGRDGGGRGGGQGGGRGGGPETLELTRE